MAVDQHKRNESPPSAVPEATFSPILRSRRRRLVRIVIPCALIAVLALLAFGLSVYGRTQQLSPDSWFDSASRSGQAEGKSQKEIIDALDAEVARNMVNISISSVIEVRPGERTGVARIENIAANRVDQKVAIVLNDTGEIVYQSGAIAPGDHIQTIEFTRPFEKGTYRAQAVFTSYDRSTHQKTGQASVEVSIAVGE